MQCLNEGWDNDHDVYEQTWFKETRTHYQQENHSSDTSKKDGSGKSLNHKLDLAHKSPTVWPPTTEKTEETTKTNEKREFTWSQWSDVK